MLSASQIDFDHHPCRFYKTGAQRFIKLTNYHEPPILIEQSGIYEKEEELDRRGVGFVRLA
jgi:hypothetical protein